MDGSKHTPSPAELAQSCMQACQGDLAKAVEMMERKVAANHAVFREIMTPLLREACYTILRKLVRQERRAIWAAPNYTQGGNGERLEVAALTLLDFPLPHNQMPLRDARRDDVLAGADWYQAQADDMQHKARWLREIATRIGGATVAKKLSAEALNKLKEACA